MQNVQNTMMRLEVRLQTQRTTCSWKVLTGSTWWHLSLLELVSTWIRGKDNCWWFDDFCLLLYLLGFQNCRNEFLQTVKLSLYLNLYLSLNLNLSLRDRDRADTIITFHQQLFKDLRLDLYSSVIHHWNCLLKPILFLHGKHWVDRGHYSPHLSATGLRDVYC